jgi:hypothetical protein
MTAAPRSVDRKPLPRYGAVEGALARGLPRRAQTLGIWRVNQWLPCNPARRSQCALPISAHLAPRIPVG